jgi:methylmalonyl-CoA mutase N-terminal domain/subunit
LTAELKSTNASEGGLTLGAKNLYELIANAPPQREIARSAFEFQREVDTGRRSIVGVNKYTTPDDGDHIPTLKIEHATESGQIDRIKAFRTRRDPAAVERALAAVRTALQDDRQNVMPPILDAVKQHVTLGQICDLFRSELGEYRDPAYL